MKVLAINAVYGISSTGRICLELHDYLVREGHSCLTVYGTDKGKYEDAKFVGNLFTRKFSALLSRITGKSGYYCLFNTKKIIKIIEDYKPDVVHIHNIHANFVNIPKLLEYLAKKDIPTVVTLHDCFFYTGGCMHYTANGCFKWKIKCEKCKFKTNAWFFDRTSKMFNDKLKGFNAINRLAVVGVSDWITNEAKQSPIFKNAKIIERIYNGIDLSVFRFRATDFKEKYGLQGKKVVLGVASGWSEKKGLKVFCDLAEKLDDSYAVVLVGKVAGARLPEKLIHIPSTDNVEELVDIYNGADVLLQASKEETFGKVVAEALASGVPVITNDSTANPELVDDKCGIVLHDFSTENIIGAIKTIVEDKTDETSIHCRKRAETFFNKDDYVRDYCKIFSDIIA